ncbi:gamma-glutamyltransferase [Sphingoaurantiacus capsulatus]|uniref:Glutathione hydrolase proenzyme n=1 Tax=Sphingoaurantiacus capsulatus TaxID=1771310 RepID=A0ABV7XB50_9SPHN
MRIASRLLPLLLLAACSTTTIAERPSAAPSSIGAAVSAADPRAAEAGREILAKGGSAVDAAAAVMLALTVVEPQSSGIGGGSFIVVHDAKTGLATYDGREEAPSSATPKWFLDAAGKAPASFDAARAGGRSVGVPGNIANIALAHKQHGKLPWAAIFQPAIKLARDGFAITPRFHGVLESYRSFLSSSPEAQLLYYQADGTPKPLGATVYNPALASFLSDVAEHGPEHFYRGKAAERLVAAVRSSPRSQSTMTVADVAAYESRPRAPVCGQYRTYKVCGMGPPSSGGPAVYAILKQLERFDLPAMKRSDATTWHLISESMRLAYADRAQWIADPDHTPVPTAGLMSDSYMTERSSLIAADKRMATAPAGNPPGAMNIASAPDTEVAGTSSLSVADAAGNVVAMTSTIEAPFGSGVLVDGYVLNNELTDFNLVPDVDGVPTANRVQPGKRPRSSMAPMIAYDAAGKPVLSIGAAGGATIIAQVAKAMIGVLDWKMSVQDAIAMPQVVAMGDLVRLEKGTDLEALAPALTAMGHKVQITGLPLKANGVELAPQGWRGGADPRSEGESLAFGQALLEPK